jgi:hypothetical protein
MSRPKPIELGVALLILGGVFLWNTWVFGFVNRGLAGYTQMSISELNVVGQPFSHFFTVTEWLSGLFLLFGGTVLLAALRRANLFLLGALLLISILGALTVFDATHPVDCNRYDNSACALKWARGEVTTEHQEHGLESEMSDYVIIALAAMLILWAAHQRLSEQIKSFPYEIPAVVLFSLAILLPPLVISTNDITVDSVGQRAWNTLTSLAFIYVGYKIWYMKSYSQRKTRKAIA